MIALSEANSTKTEPNQLARNGTKVPSATSWHDGFLTILPAIRRETYWMLRHLRCEAREDATADVIAVCVEYYVSLATRGKEHLAFPAPLVRFAVARFRSGRRLGSSLNTNDLSAPYCQQRKGTIVERLHRVDHSSGDWQAVVVESMKSGPAETATLRIDFADWLSSLHKRNREIAESLAVGETTTAVARLFRITPGRVAQLRRELYAAWCAFQGEPNLAAVRVIRGAM